MRCLRNYKTRVNYKLMIPAYLLHGSFLPSGLGCAQSSEANLGFLNSVCRAQSNRKVRQNFAVESPKSLTLQDALAVRRAMIRP